jgi:hypothetical protein
MSAVNFDLWWTFRYLSIGINRYSFPRKAISKNNLFLTEHLDQLEVNLKDSSVS